MSISASGENYFDNLDKYSTTAQNQMELYKESAVQNLQASGGRLITTVKNIQESGEAITALGMATKALNKKLPASLFEGKDLEQGGLQGQKGTFLDFVGGKGKSFSSQMREAVFGKQDRLSAPEGAPQLRGDYTDTTSFSAPKADGAFENIGRATDLPEGVSDLDATEDRLNRISVAGGEDPKQAQEDELASKGSEPADVAPREPADISEFDPVIKGSSDDVYTNPTASLRDVADPRAIPEQTDISGLSETTSFGAPPPAMPSTEEFAETTSFGGEVPISTALRPTQVASGTDIAPTDLQSAFAPATRGGEDLDEFGGEDLGDLGGIGARAIERTTGGSGFRDFNPVSTTGTYESPIGVNLFNQSTIPTAVNQRVPQPQDLDDEIRPFQAQQQASDAVQGARGVASGAVQDAQQQARGVASGAQQQASDAQQQARGAVDDARGAVSDAQEQARGAVSDAQQQAQQAQENITSKISDVGNQASEAFQNTKGTLSDTFENMGSKVSGAVEGATGEEGVSMLGSLGIDAGLLGAGVETLGATLLLGGLAEELLGKVKDKATEAQEDDPKITMGSAVGGANVEGFGEQGVGASGIV